MFEYYRATREDFAAIEEGINTVWHPKLGFVFGDSQKMTHAVVVSYDSKFIYLWLPWQILALEKLNCRLPKHNLYRLPHRLKLKNEWQYAWCAAIWDKQIEKLLPAKIRRSTRFKIPRISGGLLKPFIELQKRKKLKNNPYTTRESFLATIIHEFAHIYWDQLKLWWYSDKRENLSYLSQAEKLYKNKGEVPYLPLTLPTNIAIGETFAFCAEYYASGLFWPKHKKALDIFAEERIKELIKSEQKKDLEKEDSVIDPTRNPHDFARVLGKIIINQYPQTWPRILNKFLPITT